jgi:hypothetical protein
MSRKTKRGLTDEQGQRIAPGLPQYRLSPKGGTPRSWLALLQRCGAPDQHSDKQVAEEGLEPPTRGL